MSGDTETMTGSAEATGGQRTELRDGLLLVDKATGLTSHDVVQRARRITGQKKIGHCGTLDPDATGLLLLTLGRATRLTRFLIRAPKVYEGTLRLGVTTDTYDAAGEAVEEAPAEAVAAVTLDDVERAMEGLRGEIDHLPPAYSAKKVGGRKLYELAREGKEVPQEAKRVTVYELRPLGELEHHDDGTASVRFRVGCSSGTYARTLAHDVGREVGTGGHLAALRRLKVGPFELADAVTLEELEQALDAGATPSGLVPFDTIPLPFGEIEADAQQEERVLHGQTVLVRELEGDEGDWVKVVDRRRRFIAVGTIVERIGTGGVGIVQPRVVFN